ncbi:MAG: signal peptidase I [Bacillota bacterium]
MENLRVWIKKILFNEIVLAIILALILKAYVMDSRYVPSSSMHPTLQVKDRLLVNKLAYKFGDIQRGDIIIFEPPPSVDSKYDYVKRVVGLPGETVAVKQGVVYIDGKALDESYVNETPLYEFQPAKVPDGSLFVLGDNRNHSFDSHLWIEWLSISDVKGKVFFRYWPLDRIGRVN